MEIDSAVFVENIRKWIINRTKIVKNTAFEVSKTDVPITKLQEQSIWTNSSGNSWSTCIWNAPEGTGAYFAMVFRPLAEVILTLMFMEILILVEIMGEQLFIWAVVCWF